MILPTVRVKLLKYADAILGRAAVHLLPSPGQHLNAANVPVNRILMIRPGGIGDAVLLVPALRSIRHTYPHASVHVLAESRNAAVFDLVDGIDQVLLYDTPSQLVKVLRTRYDLVVDTEQWHRLSAVVARLTGAPVLIGFGTNDRERLFTHPVPYLQEDYEADSFLHLLKPFMDVSGRDRVVPFLTVRPDLLALAARVLEPLKSRRIVALFPGSSIRERKWGASRFRETAQKLGRDGYGIVVVGGEPDRKAGETIVQGIPSSLNLCGQLSLPGTAAVLDRCDLLIAGDSGVMHIGYGLDVRIVALFGPGR